MRGALGKDGSVAAAEEGGTLPTPNKLKRFATNESSQMAGQGIAQGLKIEMIRTGSQFLVDN